MKPTASSMRRWPRRPARISFGSLILAGPGFVLYVALVVGSVAVAAFFSVTDWNGISPSFKFVGFDNFLKGAPADPLVGYSFLVTFIIAVSGTVITNAIAIPIAVLLNHRDLPTRVLRSIIVYPIVLSPIVVGILWGSSLGTNGVLSTLLQGVGLPPAYILADPAQAIAAIIFVSVWHTLGICIILYLAGLQVIPPELDEAARIDGAGAFQRFQHVTLPLLAPTMTMNVVVLLIWFMRTYDYVLVMTSGGPITATNTIAFLLLSRTFQGFRYGFGSALAIVLLFVTVALAAIVFVLSRRREAYL